MLEIVALATAVLGFLVWNLYRQHKQLRSELDSRVRAIEDLGEPFASKLAASVAVVPLKRGIHLGIHMDEAFWRETLQLSPEELKEIRTSVDVHKKFSDVAAKGRLEELEDFESWFFGDIWVQIQE